MKKSEFKQIIREEFQKTQKQINFKNRERNAGVEDDEGEYVNKNKGTYVKAEFGGYMPSIYHNPHINGKTDGKLYKKDKTTGKYIPLNEFKKS